MLKIDRKIKKPLLDCIKYLLDNDIDGAIEDVDFGKILDPDEYKDYDVDINKDSDVYICLGGDSETPTISVKNLMDFCMDSTPGHLLEGQGVATTKNRVDYLVQPTGYEDYHILDGYFASNHQYPSKQWIANVSIGKEEYGFCIYKGLSFYHFLVHISGNYEDFYPCYNEDDYFISITKKDGDDIDIEVSKKIADALIFELYTSHGIHLHYTQRASDYTEDFDEKEDYPIFPLIIGKGTSGIIHLFLKAMDANDPDFEILCLSRIIEYVSPTLIKNQMNSEVMQKLLSPRVFSPDADYVSELGHIFNTHARYEKNDFEMYKLTIKSIVNLDELKDSIPKFIIKDFAELLSEKETEKLLVEIAQSISDTRNQIAHAKANYKLKGMECPDNEKMIL